MEEASWRLPQLDVHRPLCAEDYVRACGSETVDETALASAAERQDRNNNKTVSQTGAPQHRRPRAEG